MKVYVLAEESYGHHKNLAVFTDKNKAYETVNILRRINRGSNPTVEEFETDDFRMEKPSKIGWEIWFAENGDVTSVEQVYDEFERMLEPDVSSITYNIGFIINKFDKETAIKIAKTHRASILAERFGLR